MKTVKFIKIRQKIITTIIGTIALFAFIVPNYSQATFGGTLMTPICDLLAAIGDGVNWVMTEITGENGWPYLTGKYAYTSVIAQAQDGSNKSGGTNVKLIYSKGDTTEDEDATSEQAEGQYANEDVGAVGVPNIKLSPIEIFSNRVALLDANFFKDQDETTYNEQMLGGTENSPAYQLRETLSSWYKTFRLIAIVGLLSVLVYLGIRIVISSVAEDKAKYKQMLTDWVIALCLVFFLHYIMVFTMTMVEEITKGLIGSSSTSATVKEINVEVVNVDETKYKMEWDGSATSGEETKAASAGTNWDIIWEWYKKTNPVFALKGYSDALLGQIKGQQAVQVTYSTDLTGYVRALVESPTAGKKLVYTIMYLALTFYVVYFFVIYLKRLIILAFLTMIAPLVALTYPIDKVKDGKAQAFDFWLKEYIANAMLPIIHLVLYSVLISSALPLVSKLPIYALVVLAFMTKAEKLVKDMFGISSHTAPSAADLVGANIIGSTLSKAAGRLGGKSGGKAPGKIRTANNDNVTDPNLVEGSGKDDLLNTLVGGSAAAGGATAGAEVANTNVNRGLAAAQARNSIAETGRTAIPAQSGSTGATGRMPTVMETSGNRIPASSRQTASTPKKLDNKKKVTLKGIAHNAGNMTRERFNVPRGITKQMLAKRLATGAGRAALKATALGTAGALGLAGGMVGGDLNSMAKGLAGGLASGTILGNGLANRVPSVDAIQDFNTELAYGKVEADNVKADRDSYEDYENRRHLMEDKGLSAKETNERLDEYTNYRRAGITSIKEMDRMHDIKNYMADKYNLSEEEAQSRANELANMMPDYSKDTFIDEKKYENSRKGLSKQTQRLKNCDKDSADSAATEIMDYLGWAKGVYKDRKAPKKE